MSNYLQGAIGVAVEQVGNSVPKLVDVVGGVIPEVAELVATIE